MRNRRGAYYRYRYDLGKGAYSEARLIKALKTDPNQSSKKVAVLNPAQLSSVDFQEVKAKMRFF